MNALFERCTALTGGIATGKSTVAKKMESLGAHIIDTDAIARLVVEPGKPALASIVEEFGVGVLNNDGSLNREAVRNDIIRYPDKRNKLNSFTHPEISKEVLRLIQEISSTGSANPILIDVPLLFEVRWHLFFNRVILVYVPVQVQIERLMHRDNLTRSIAEMTLTAQMNIEDKKKLAQIIIDNSGSLLETESQVKIIYDKLLTYNPRK